MSEDTLGDGEISSMDIKRPPKSLSEVESEFILDEIQHREFALEEDREYIADLVQIEQYVLNPPDGFGGGKHFGLLRNRHPDAYDHIQRELDPEGYEERKRRKREHARQKEETKSSAHRAREKLETYRKQWEAVTENESGEQV